MPGPRQEYLDAFDGGPGGASEDVFAAGAPARRAQGEPAGPGGPDAGAGAPHAAGPPRGGIPARREASPEEDGGSSERPDASGPETPQTPEKGHRGRAFTGVAAAAVTTVLAVVVAGQIIGGEDRRDTRAASADAADDAGEDGDGEEDKASRSETRPTPSRPAAPALTYAQKMAEIHPLDPTLAGPGDFAPVGGRGKAPGGGQILRYRVDVEKDLPLDGELFAEAVHTTLNDDRSWAHDGARGFERVASGDADFVITLASPATTGEWCAKSGLDTTERNVSCDSASTRRIMINAWRWAQGSETFGDERIRAYREMLINHEVGHRLGRGHVFCEKDGGLAPVMMQQTKTLTTDGDTCRPNAWPYPRS